MTDAERVRRVRPDEHRRVRELRLAALGDPAASIAFLGTLSAARSQPEEFWRDRTERVASGDGAAQFVALDGEDWVGSATVLIRGDDPARADVVAVYVRPAHRGRGHIDRLLDAAASWAAGHGLGMLHLSVHADNARAQTAYRRAGFAPTGVRFTGPIGPELEFARPLRQ
jgi:RimJ/RimL family protein N-acetyltransferase